MSLFERREPKGGRKRIDLWCELAAETPVWAPGRPPQMIHLEDLPLSGEVREALRAWNATYDEADGGVGRQHEAEGRRLERVVQEDLGPGWQVRYRP